MSSVESRILQETRGEPGALLDRCVVLAERVSTLEDRLRARIAFWEADADDARAAAESYEGPDGDPHAAVDLHRTANRSTAAANELRAILAGLGADPATQETSA